MPKWCNCQRPISPIQSSRQHSQKLVNARLLASSRNKANTTMMVFTLSAMPIMSGSNQKSPGRNAGRYWKANREKRCWKPSNVMKSSMLKRHGNLGKQKPCATRIVLWNPHPTGLPTQFTTVASEPGPVRESP